MTSTIASTPLTVLTLPGWQNSGPDHWQSHWERTYGYSRVEQHDWMRPLRGDWSVRLEEVVVDAPGPVLLVAHSLGCILTAWWAAHSHNVGKVQGALLVAPGDVEQPDLIVPLRGWSPVLMQPLPFQSILVASDNDPYCSFERAQKMSNAWGSRLVNLGAHGHINAESGLGNWPAGHDLLVSLETSKD